MRFVTIVPALAFALAGCATVGADGFADVAADGEVLQIAGIDAGRSGDFVLSPLGIEGRFKRSAVSKGTNGELRHDGRLSFELTDSGEFSGLSAQCASSRESLERTVAWTSTSETSVSVDTGPYVMTCGFYRGAEEIGGLELRAERGSEGDPRDIRTGYAAAHGAEMRLSSLHRFDSAAAPSIEPLGYRMTFRDGGEAMFDMTNNRIAMPRDSEDRRHAVLLASIAIGLMWEPGS